ncbi:unnamed protein product [Pseudo-nitzschia multistriata]|uniref:Transmembrane protein n=1 Tax=Pseudo-nitzschia multistriata TaxID=183589 RepID=A0A448ZE00_9STRA|nr:unnamed protein product [Pseudo-nitzschia multistriata]
MNRHFSAPRPMRRGFGTPWILAAAVLAAIALAQGWPVAAAFSAPLGGRPFPLGLPPGSLRLQAKRGGSAGDRPKRYGADLRREAREEGRRLRRERAERWEQTGGPGSETEMDTEGSLRGRFFATPLGRSLRRIWTKGFSVWIAFRYWLMRSSPPTPPP